MGAIESVTGHRPWPMPSRPWVMFQSWRDLLFAHWPVPANQLRALVPHPLQIERFDGSAWVGQTPFRLAGLRARPLPPLPGLSDFPEMNLRTYVRVGDRPGVFFFSLDAGNRLAVLLARIGYRLPYFPARMSIEDDGDRIRYRSDRRVGSASFAASYAPVGDPFTPARGTVEYFLTERYALYTVTNGGRVIVGEIHHAPWLLRRAEAEISANTVPAAAGITLPDSRPMLHFARGQDTIIWPPRRLRGVGDT